MKSKKKEESDYDWDAEIVEAPDKSVDDENTVIRTCLRLREETLDFFDTCIEDFH